jgi:hypothetical protein
LIGGRWIQIWVFIDPSGKKSCVEHALHFHCATIPTCKEDEQQEMSNI